MLDLDHNSLNHYELPPKMEEILGIKKGENDTLKAGELFETYPGGRDAFFSEFREFLMDPRRFIYTPLILCKGMKPLSP